MPRKTIGCWTCRARKKKCDAARPLCGSCAFRGVTCYGYGPKPEWMDGAMREKETLRAMGLQCKLSYSQRRSTQIKSRRRPSPYSLAPRPSGTVNMGQARSPPNVSPIPTPLSSNRTTEHQFSCNEAELSLVMYYLDHIFDRLCPFFKYTPTDDGRGWLLSLFLRTRPLCALAVCISACDKAQLVFGALNETPEPHHDLEMQHIQIVTDTRDHLSRLNEQRGANQMAAAVEALACIMHLILFELWIPRRNDMENDWILHLDAASVLLHSVAKKPLDSIGQVLANGRIEDYFPIENLSQVELSAFCHYHTLYTYYYISMNATIGLTPKSKLSLDRTYSIFHDQQCKLQAVIGCEDWVMITILDIVMLREWKLEANDFDHVPFDELERRATRVEERLTEGLAKLASRKTTVASFYEQQQNMVTDIFINGALLFLHAVRLGLHPNLPDIQCSVLQTLHALEYMRKNSSINIPSWPYCVAGCLATESLYPRFRALLPPRKEGRHPLVNTKWTLDIMQESWSLRQSQLESAGVCHWGTAMTNLQTRILLA